MAKSTYHNVKGIAKWARVHKPDEKYNVFKICLYPDKKSMKTITNAGCSGEFKEDEDGSYYTFRRKPQVLSRAGKLIDFGPPKVTDAEGETYAGLIGNGSEVEVTFVTYPTEKGVGTRLDAIKVLKLVEYNPDEAAA